MEKVQIKKSRNGKGIFAKKSFNKGEVILDLKGTFMSCDEECVVDEKTRSNTIRFDKEKYLSPAGELGDFLNHSCNPNSAVIKKRNALFIVAVKHLGAGEEVTIDYSTIIASDDSWEMKCNCGSANCRIKIAKFITLPKAIKQAYLSSKMVPKYILN